MDKYANRIVTNIQGYTTQTANGRNYLVVSAVPAREQVMNNYYVPAKELSFADMWNGTPITIRHPKRNNGSANVPTPDVGVIGRFFNAKWDNEGNKLTGEYWIDIDEAMRYVEGQYIIRAIYDNKVLETSTGYWADEELVTGEFNGKSYSTIHHNLKPDHIAILVDEIGACSVADGCGVNRNSLVNRLWTNECMFTQGGAGSGDFGHGGRPGSVGGSSPRTKSKPSEKKSNEKALNKEVKAYYVVSGNQADKYKNGYGGQISLYSREKAESLFNSMTQSGSDPVIFEITLKKGTKYKSISSGSITIDGISGGAMKKITGESLKSATGQPFSNNMMLNADCGCPDLEKNQQDPSLYDTIESIRKAFYDEFMGNSMMMDGVYIEDIFPDFVVCETGEELYKVNYSLDKDGKPVFDSKDKWVRVEEEYVEQPASTGSTDTTQNADMPASCYLVVEDNGAMHLPVKDPDGTPNHRLMGAAWAALHGGYRGQKYQGPNKAEAIAKLKALYAKEKMPVPAANSVWSLNMVTNDTGTLPPAGVKIYEAVYTRALKQYKGDKARASKIAWGAVKRAGWTQTDGKWILKKGDTTSNNRKGNQLVTNQSKETKLMSKMTFGKVLDLLRGKGVEVQVNSEEEGLNDIELELEEAEEESTVQNTASPFTNDEVKGLKALLAIDWTGIKGMLDKLPTVMEMAQNAETEKTTRKAELVGLIMNSSSNVFSKEELEAMALPTLTKMNAQLNINYAGLAGGYNEVTSDDEILGLPVMEVKE